MGLSYNDINTLFSDPTIEYSGGTRIVWSANQVYYDEAIVGISPGVQYDTIVVGKEAISGNSGTLAKHPIVPGSVILSNGYSTFIDNGLGVLYASLSPHTGTINYTNGNWSVTGWVGITAATAMYMAVTSPAFVSIDWDGVMFPTIKGLTYIKPVGTGERCMT
jgi:hypothetical protein